MASWREAAEPRRPRLSTFISGTGGVVTNMSAQEAITDAIKDEAGHGYSRHHSLLAYLAYALIALPIISLTIKSITWLKYGVDLPYWDDWRQYATGNAGRLDLQYLLTPANDTLYAVGLLLDSLAVRFLGGNPIAYQFISMIATLGALLWLQWRLISKCIDDLLTKACIFSITVLMLQPGSYWGVQSIAFHQAIPLVCTLAALNILLHDAWKAAWAVPSLAMVSLVSGFSYISGAFAMFGLSITVLIAQYTTFGARRRQLGISGLSLLGPTLISMPAQLWVIIAVQKGTHRPDGSMAYPWEADFWWFILGKIGRSLVLPQSHPTFSFWLTLTITLLTLSFLFIAITKMASRKLSTQDSSLMLIFASLAVVIALYLFLVAAGRTNMKPDHAQSPVEIFLFGFNRFHFFWVTLLWPWLAALILSAASQRKLGRAPATLSAIALLAVILLGTKYHGLLDHDTYYRTVQTRQVEGLICLQQAIAATDNIHCPQIFPGRLETSYAKATEVNATFTRFLRYQPIPLGSSGQRPLYRLSEQPDNIRLHNAERISSSGSDLTLSIINSDPNILIATDAPAQMNRCERLQVSVLMDAEAPDIAQMFYIPAGKRGFSGAHSSSVPISNERKMVTFFLESASGFANGLRFDPVRKSQTLHIEELEVRCRSSRTGADE